TRSKPKTASQHIPGKYALAVAEPIIEPELPFAAVPIPQPQRFAALDVLVEFPPLDENGYDLCHPLYADQAFKSINIVNEVSDHLRLNHLVVVEMWPQHEKPSDYGASAETVVAMQPIREQRQIDCHGARGQVAKVIKVKVCTNA